MNGGLQQSQLHKNEDGTTARTRLESTRTMTDDERLSAYASVNDDRGLSIDTSIG